MLQYWMGEDMPGMTEAECYAVERRTGAQEEMYDSSVLLRPGPVRYCDSLSWICHLALQYHWFLSCKQLAHTEPCIFFLFTNVFIEVFRKQIYEEVSYMVSESHYTIEQNPIL